MKYNDSYEALGDLLYPSIAASGNVYYGQTRKLALDEIFKDGFRSVIKVADDNHPGYDDSPGTRYFCWSLGSFSGTVKLSSNGTHSHAIKFLKRFVRFAEYSVIPHHTTRYDEDKRINTYSIDYTIEPTGNMMSIGPLNPINKTDVWDGRDFYFDLESSKLYIAITDDETKTAFKNLSHPDELLKPITFTNTYVNSGSATGDNNITIDPGLPDGEPNIYQYKYISDDTWRDVTDHHTDHSFSGYVLEPGDSIQFKCKSDIQHYESKTRGIQFSTTSSSDSATLSVSGNITSLIRTDFTNDFSLVNKNEFAAMFINTGHIEDASRLQLPATSLTPGCYSQMFCRCLSLTFSPELPATTLANSCYSEMFSWCSLKYGPTVLPATTLQESCYYHMFEQNALLEHFPIMLAEEGSIDELDGMFTKCRVTDVFQLYFKDIVSNGSRPSIVEYDGISRSYIYAIASSTDTNKMKVVSGSEISELFYPDSIIGVVDVDQIWAGQYDPISDAINIVSDDYSHVFETDLFSYEDLTVTCESLTIHTRSGNVVIPSGIKVVQSNCNILDLLNNQKDGIGNVDNIMTNFTMPVGYTGGECFVVTSILYSNDSTTAVSIVDFQNNVSVIHYNHYNSAECYTYSYP